MVIMYIIEINLESKYKQNSYLAVVIAKELMSNRYHRNSLLIT